MFARRFSPAHRAAPVLLALLAVACDSPSSDPLSSPTGSPKADDAQAGEGSAALTYADVQQKSSHNSYERHEAIVDQLMYHRVRSIEFDLHVGKFRAPDLDDDWYVYHKDVVEDHTSCRTLVDCLASVNAFTDAVPNHEVITVWLDLKDDWDDTHRVEALDALLSEAFGDRLVVPDDLRDACPAASSLSAAVADCGWPRLSTLRGKVIVALTGGDTASPDSVLSQYLRDGDVGFVAPSVGDAAELPDVHDEAAFVNVGLCSNKTATALGKDCDIDDAAVDAIAAAASERIVRVWGVDAEDGWDRAARAGAHHLGTDFVNYERRPWAVTHNAKGWPFACDSGCTSPSEDGAVFAIEVDSGDLWERDDSFAFATLSATLPTEWEAMVSSQNADVEDYAKSCLMARTSLSADAAYFAVCRPADVRRVQIQVREDDGDQTERVQLEDPGAYEVADEGVAWLRLVVDNGGHCASGYAAVRRGEWEHIGSQCFDAPLTEQGLAASSHDADSPVRLLFAAPRLNGKPMKDKALVLREVGDAVATWQEHPVP